MVRDTVEDNVGTDPTYGHRTLPVIDAIDPSCYTPTTCDLVDPFVGELKEPVNDDPSKAPIATCQTPYHLLTGRLCQAIMPKQWSQVDKLLVNELSNEWMPPTHHHRHMYSGTDLDEAYKIVPHDTNDDEHEIVFIHDPGGGCPTIFQEAFSEEFIRELPPPWPYDQNRLSDNDIVITLRYSADKLTVYQRTIDQQSHVEHVNSFVVNVSNVGNIVDAGNGDVVDDITGVHDDPPPSDNDLVLVDQGAHGRVAGADVRVIHCTTYMVDIQGDHKRMNNNAYFGTAGSVITTDKGSIILVLHQYALFSKGRMVHAHGQARLWCNNDVNVKSSEK